MPRAGVAGATLLVVDDVDAAPFGDDPFQRELQLSELALVTTSTAAATNLAQNYVGLPFGILR